MGVMFRSARRSILAAAMLSTSAYAQTMSPTSVSEDPQVQAETADPSEQEFGAEIVVTARLRDENLMDVPVALTALTSEDLTRYGAADLSKIGELAPTVIVGNYKLNGGGP